MQNALGHYLEQKLFMRDHRWLSEDPEAFCASTAKSEPVSWCKIDSLCMTNYQSCNSMLLPLQMPSIATGS